MEFSRQGDATFKNYSKQRTSPVKVEESTAAALNYHKEGSVSASANKLLAGSSNHLQGISHVSGKLQQLSDYHQ